MNNTRAEAPMWLVCTLSNESNNIVHADWYLSDSEEELIKMLDNDQAHGANIDSEASFVIAPGKSYEERIALIDLLEKHGYDVDKW